MGLGGGGLLVKGCHQKPFKRLSLDGRGGREAAKNAIVASGVENLPEQLA